MSNVRPTIHSEGRNFISRVIQHFDKEKESGVLSAPIQNPTLRASMALGVSVRTVSQIRKEAQIAEATGSKIVTPGKKRKASARRKELNGFQECGLKNIINSMYAVEKKVPTLTDILAKAKKELKFKGKKETLRKIMKKLGYKFKKCKSNRYVLLERNDIVASRARYLRRMRNNEKLGDNKKPVTYLDETWIHPHYTVNKCWQSEKEFGVRKNDSAGQRYIIVHAGGRNGFIPGAKLVFKAKQKTGDYHDEMNFENFSKWAEERLIPNLPPNGIIIMDNAPYHSVLDNKPPTTGSRIQDIRNWLQENNIPFPPSARKSELLALVKIYKPLPSYKIDNLFKLHGHEVVRLPPYQCDLNPNEYIWNIVKARVKKENVSQLTSQIEKLANEALDSITPQEWSNTCDHVLKLEAEYWEKDGLVEEEVEKIIIELGGLETDNKDSDNENDNEECGGDSDCNVLSSSEEEDMLGIAPLD